MYSIQFPAFEHDPIVNKTIGIFLFVVSCDIKKL